MGEPLRSPWLSVISPHCNHHLSSSKPSMDSLLPDSRSNSTWWGHLVCLSSAILLCPLYGYVPSRGHCQAPFLLLLFLLNAIHPPCFSSRRLSLGAIMHLPSQVKCLCHMTRWLVSSLQSFYLNLKLNFNCRDSLILPPPPTRL